MNTDIIKNFISKTAYDFIKDTNYKFTDAEMATIIYQSKATRNEKLAAFKEIFDKTDNMKLRKEIEERIEYEKKKYDLFYDNTSFKCFYQLMVEVVNDMGYYESAELAVRNGKRYNKPFDVNKFQIVGEGDAPITGECGFNPRLIENAEMMHTEYVGDPVGKCDYSPDGEPLKVLSWEISHKEREKVDDWGESRFEWKFFELPNHVNSGDIVRCNGEVGVVTTTQKEWHNYIEQVKNKVLDFSDANVIIETYYAEDMKFSHTHEAPVFLEKITDDNELYEAIKKKVEDSYIGYETKERPIEGEVNAVIFSIKEMAEKYKSRNTEGCE